MSETEVQLEMNETEHEASDEKRLYDSGKITKLRARRSASSHILWIENREYYINMSSTNNDERDKHIFAVALAAVLNHRSVGILYRHNTVGSRIVYHIELVN